MNSSQNFKLQLSSYVIIITGAINFSSNSVLAQITPDATLPNNSNVNLSENIRTITGGTQAGSNLFHSFSEFSVPNNTEAYFNNAVDINNIITRVTGGSISNIDGLIKANGQANLFLMNPNGIIFGPGARLDIGGSFIGTSASSINFADGFSFSATTTDTKPLLTISAPIGLGMGPNPGEIKVNGLSSGSGINYDEIYKVTTDLETISKGGSPVDSNVAGLSVKTGNTLALVGGKVDVNGGVLRSPDGRIELGSVGSNARVSLLGEVWQLGYEGVTNFGDILLSGQALANVSGVGGGNISLRGGNINLTGQSILLADTLGDRNGGLISIVGDSITFNQARASNNTFGSGNAGQINVSANNSITFEKQGSIASHTNSLGNGGEINLKADSIIIRDSNSGASSFSFVNAQGQSGKIKVEANSLTIDNGSLVTTSFSSGKAGEIDINVNGDLKLSNGSGITSWTAGSAKQGGLIKINANSVLIENETGINADAIEGSTGNAGNIDIRTNDFRVRKAGISSETKGSGNGGLVSITARNSLSLQEGGFTTATNGVGNAGSMNLEAGQLTLKDFSIRSRTQGSGNGGTINIRANNSLDIQDGELLLTTDGTGNAGNIKIFAPKFTLTRTRINTTTNSFDERAGVGGLININTENDLIIKDSPLTSSSKGQGNAGQIKIQAGNFTLTSDLNTNAEANSRGNAGEIKINVRDRFVIDSGRKIESTTASSGQGGKITINANVLEMVDTLGINTNALTDSTGNAGEINITVPGSLRIIRGSGVNSTTQGSGDGGRINIDANSVVIQQTGVRSNTEGTGNAGAININVGDMKIWEGDIRSTTKLLGEGAGDGGLVTINANSMSLDNAGIFLNTEGTGNAGEVNIQVGDLVMINTSGIKSETGATDDSGRIPASGNGGKINIIANNIRMNNRAAIAVGAKKGSTGQAGEINITVNGSLELTTDEPTQSITLNESIASPSRTSILVLSEGSGNAGTLNLTAGSILLNNSRIIGSNTSGNGGSLTLNVAQLLQLRNNSRISTTAGTSLTPSGNGGDININTPNGFIVAFTGENSDITANAFGGSGGKINITALDIFGMSVISGDDLARKLGTNDPEQLDPINLPTNDITAISQTSPNLDGQVNINTPDVDPSRAIVEFPINIVDSSNLIASACFPRSRENQASFVSTGRSGLPANPTEALQDSSILQSWVRVPQGESGRVGERGRVGEISESPTELVEATGWVVDKNGKVHLVASAAQGNQQVNRLVPSFCPLPRG